MGSSHTKHSHENKHAANVVVIPNPFLKNIPDVKQPSTDLSMNVHIQTGTTVIDINKVLTPVMTVRLSALLAEARKNKTPILVNVTGEFVPSQVDMTPVTALPKYAEPPLDVALSVNCCFESVAVCQQFMTFCMIRCAQMNTRISEVDVSPYHDVSDRFNLSTLRLYQDQYFHNLEGDGNMNVVRMKVEE